MCSRAPFLISPFFPHFFPPLSPSGPVHSPTTSPLFSSPFIPHFLTPGKLQFRYPSDFGTLFVSCWLRPSRRSRSKLVVSDFYAETLFKGNTWQFNLFCAFVLVSPYFPVVFKGKKVNAQECAEYGGTGCTGPTWTKLVPMWPSWTSLAKLVVILLYFAFSEKRLWPTWTKLVQHSFPQYSVHSWNAQGKKVKKRFRDYQKRPRLGNSQTPPPRLLLGYPPSIVNKHPNRRQLIGCFLLSKPRTPPKSFKFEAPKPWSANRELRGWQKRDCREGCQEQPEKGA